MGLPTQDLKEPYFLNLMHSIIEDTVLVLLIGANIFIVVIGRLLFSISVLLMLNLYWTHSIQKNPTKSSNWPEKLPILRQLISGELMLKRIVLSAFLLFLMSLAKCWFKNFIIMHQSFSFHSYSVEVFYFKGFDHLFELWFYFFNSTFRVGINITIDCFWLVVEFWFI